MLIPSLSKMEHHKPQQIAILIKGINRNLNLNLQNIVYTILNINNEIEKLAILKQKYLNKFFG